MPLQLFRDAEGRIEYRDLQGQFVCIDLRTEAQRQQEREAAPCSDKWVFDESEWLIRMENAAAELSTTTERLKR